MGALILAFAGAFAAAGAVLRYGGVVTRARAITGTVVVASAAGAALAEGEPTGLEVFDVLLRAGLGAAAAAAGPAVPSALLASLGLLGVAFGAGGAGGPVSAAATGVGVAALAAGVRAPVVAAAGSALIAQAALRLDWPATTGATAAVAAVMLAPLLVAGLSLLPERPRRRVGWGVGAVVVLAGVSSFLALVAALQAREDVDEAVRLARRALDAVGEAGSPEATERFEAAGVAFEDARDTMAAPWVWPARLVPVVGQHTRAVHDLAATGADLAETGADAINDTDVDRLRLREGVIDLAALASIEEPAARTLASLDAAIGTIEDIDSPWLVGPFADRIDDLEEEVRRARGDVALIRDASVAVPRLLGGSGERRYFLAVMTPAETRPAGGVIGSYGEIAADRGRLDMVRSGRVAEVAQSGDPRSRELDGPPEFLARYGRFRPATTWNVAMTPDFPTMAEVVGDLYPQSGGGPIDGVIGITPTGLAAFLALTGPVEAEGWPEPLTADNVESVLLHEQYLAFAEDERREFLGDATDAIWERITSMELPAPSKLGEVLGPAVRARHVLVESFDDGVVPFLDRIGVRGQVPPVSGDSLGVFSANGSGNKIDWFLRREVAYRPVVDLDSGATRAELEVTFHNDAPPGLPRSVTGGAESTLRGAPAPTDAGENRVLASVYSPLRILGASVVDGELEARVFGEELGRQVVTAQFVVPPGASRTLRVELAGTLDVDGGYTLSLLPQAMVHADEIEVELDARGDDGPWLAEELEVVDDAGRATASLVLDEPVRLALAPERAPRGFLDRFAWRR